MSVFDPAPSYRVAQPFETARIALDMPLTPLNNFWNQVQEGAVTSFGLGTVIRTLATPALETNPDRPFRGETPENYAARRSRFDAVTLDESEFKASQFYREGIPWERGMTPARAASLADQFDLRQARQYFGAKDPLGTLAGQFLGAAIDPINFVPVFGPAARLAATARFGFVAGHAMIGASEAAINTAVFGLLSAPARAKFGDDVSFEASINNIAFSAVAGGIFGALGGAIGRAASMRAAKAERDARFATETVPNIAAARDVLGDGVASYIETGEVRLSPRSQTTLERMATEATDRRLAARALDTETAGITGSKPGEVAISPSGARVAVRTEVVERSSLQKATGALQVRDRSATNAMSATQIQDIALNLDPVRLMPNTDASQGAPIVGPDNIVDSGNGRVAAIGLAYETYPEKAAAYRQAIVDAGYPEAATMQQPVLISRRVTDLSPEARAQFNADINGPTTARMGAVEIAAMDRAALTDSVMDTFDPALPVTAAGNRPFVARFVGGLPLNERGALVDPAGNLSADGVRRIENAMMAAAYGDVDAVAVRKFAEATDDNTRTIVGALADVAGKWISMRRAVARGEITPDFDPTVELMQALRSLSGWREQAAREGRPVNMVIKEGLAQGDFLEGIGLAKVFIRSFYEDATFTKAAARDKVSARLGDIVDAAHDLGQPDMLGEAWAATKLGVLKRVYNDVEADFFEAADSRTGTEALGGAGRRSRTGATGEGDPLGNGQDGNSRAAAAGRLPAGSPDEIVASNRALKAAQPARSFDDLYAVAERHQSTLDAAGNALEGDGIKWKNPGTKARADAEAKIGRKGYESTSELTDIVRGGFMVKTPQDAEKIVAALAQQFRVLDEGWNITEAGFFDRKVLVQFDDGTIGEVQIWHPDMASAKFEKGDPLYKQMRGLKPDDPKFIELLQKQKDLYAEAVGKVSDDWLPVISRLASELESGGGKPASGKASSNAAGESLRPESNISAASASRQSPPDAGLNQAEPPVITAGRPSQSKNDVSISENIVAPTVDMQEPKPEPPPDGLAEAAGRVGKGEDMRALADQFGVDQGTGDFAEMVEIDQLRESGRLTPEDIAELADAERTRADADAYAETLRAAAACVMG